MDSSSSFLKLPLELREIVVGHLVEPSTLPPPPWKKGRLRNPCTAQCEIRMHIEPGDLCRTRTCLEYIDAGLDLKRLAPVRFVCRAIKDLVDRYVQHLINLEERRPGRETFYITFQNMGDMSYFLRKLSPVGRSRITTIMGYWQNRPFHRGDVLPPQPEKHICEEAAGIVFDLIRKDCISLSCFVFKVYYAWLEKFDAKGELRRRVELSECDKEDVVIPEMKELRELERALEAREGKFVNVREPDNDVRLALAMA